MLIVLKRAAAVVATTLTVFLVASCSTSAPKSPEQLQAEQVTAERVYSALNADPNYYFRHVDVRVDGGVAHLSGYIWSIDAIYRAKQIAGKVPGVTRVVNEMELERQGTRGGKTGSG